PQALSARSGQGGPHPWTLSVPPANPTSATRSPLGRGTGRQSQTGPESRDGRQTVTRPCQRSPEASTAVRLASPPGNSSAFRPRRTLQTSVTGSSRPTGAENSRASRRAAACSPLTPEDSGVRRGVRVIIELLEPTI